MTVARTRSSWILAVLTLAACGSDGDTTVATQTPDDPSAAGASCEDPERLAEVLASRGIEADYEPSDSPAELASYADAVFGGELTGRVSSNEMVSSDDPHPWTFVGFEVEVTRVVKAAGGVGVGEAVDVFVEFAPPSLLDLADGDRTLVDAETPVVVFAGHQPELGELTAFVPEGFMTACPDGTLLGERGTQGQWLELDGLEAILDAAAIDAPTATPPTTSTTAGAIATTTETTTAPGSDGPSALPDRSPTVTGTVGTDEAGRPGTLDDASDGYYAGMGLRQGDPVVVDTGTGEFVPIESLRAGERISVWIDGGCRESLPVQCDITAIAVHRDG